MTHLTKASSKKAVNHAQMVAIDFMHFVHIHQTIKITPARAAGVMDNFAKWPIW